MPDIHPGTQVTTALAVPATVRAVADRRRRAWRWAGTGITAVVIGLAVGPGAHEAGVRWLSALAVFCVGCGSVAAAVAVAALVNSRRIAAPQLPMRGSPATRSPSRRGRARHAWCCAIRWQAP